MMEVPKYALPEEVMRELTIGKNDAGQRLDRFVAKSLPLLPPALLPKCRRL